MYSEMILITKKMEKENHTYIRYQLTKYMTATYTV